MTLVKNLAKEEYEIVWPVLDYFVDGLQRAYPDVKFVPKESMNIDYENFHDFENDEYRQIPLRYIGDITQTLWHECMYEKYKFYNMEFQSWKDLAYYHRNNEKEIELFNTLGLEKNEKYNLIAPFFGSQFQSKLDIKPENDYKNIELKNINGFSLFDWSYVIENATNLYIPNSAPILIVELLNPKAEEIHLYSRYPNEDHFLTTIKLHTKNYIYHTKP
jgi:hypothetical protein